MTVSKKLRRATSLADLRFVATFGEFWLALALVAVLMAAIGAAAGVLVGARLLLDACFP